MKRIFLPIILLVSAATMQGSYGQKPNYSQPEKVYAAYGQKPNYSQPEKVYAAYGQKPNYSQPEKVYAAYGQEVTESTNKPANKPIETKDATLAVEPHDKSSFGLMGDLSLIDTAEKPVIKDKTISADRQKDINAKIEAAKKQKEEKKRKKLEEEKLVSKETATVKPGVIPPAPPLPETIKVAGSNVPPAPPLPTTPVAAPTQEPVSKPMALGGGEVKPDAGRNALLEEIRSKPGLKPVSEKKKLDQTSNDPLKEALEKRRAVLADEEEEQSSKNSSFD
jgi:hypothetical protein